tara:strand:- start:2326 stop:2850 length:525 start_codon:yes stop_codon:yes gene_type:complete
MLVTTLPPARPVPALRTNVNTMTRLLPLIGALALGACQVSHESPSSAPIPSDEVGDTAVPLVLVFPEEYMADALFVAEPNWFSVRYAAGGLNMQILGTHVLSEPPEGMEMPEPNVQVRGNHGFRSESEDIHYVTWVESGVAFELSYYCQDDADERCAEDDAWGVALADRLEQRR